MLEYLVIAAVVLSAASVILLLYLYAKLGASVAHQGEMKAAFENLERSGERLERLLREELGRNRDESAATARQNREELAASVRELRAAVEQRLQTFGEESGRGAEATAQRLADQKAVLDEKLRQVLLDNASGAKQLRDDVAGSLRGVNESVLKVMREMADGQNAQLQALAAQFASMTQGNQQNFETLKGAVEARLKTIQEDNAKQLEQMRLTVDEKLQGTLEKRLGESFKQVSDRLEAVHKGLGEMQVLATGVGDLKRVLTNVKTRGTWGEVQLEAMLEQALNRDQYEKNFLVRDSGERVEFAIRLPGQGEEPVWLPIDAKFPIDDYQRFLDATDKCDAAGAEAASVQLERRIRDCADDICTKYLNPPLTTDFAILFLPVEGLFADVVRRPALVESLQRDCRVMIAGPTTLWSLLTSLQMGFRTLAIQKRSSEVWNLLSSVKAEWAKYEGILEKVQKKLGEASSTIEKAQTRTRVIGRRLKDVEELPAAEPSLFVPLPDEEPRK
jgi:DNA recombination protein RmuC